MFVFADAVEEVAINVSVPCGFGNADFADAKAAVIIGIVFGGKVGEVFGGFGIAIGKDASTFFEVSKTRDAGAVDFNSEHAATAHKVGEDGAYCT